MTFFVLYFKMIILAVVLKINYKGIRVEALWPAGRSLH